MKTITRNSNDCSVCIYERTNEKIRGCFFKEKPEIGDIIKIWPIEVFRVTKIIENRDARITNENCTFDPSGAYFVLGVEKV